ncbi:hypothetical protein [Streptomyces sp. NPDC046821]|uniref:hypothetical protein n=1 Tax=Streptomyces sp. NPDC046821 TaxID=3154702 RepID=UPI0033EA8CDC
MNEQAFTGPYRQIADQPGLAPVGADWVHTSPIDEYNPGEIDTIELFHPLRG